MILCDLLSSSRNMGIANRISSPGHDIQLNTGGQKLKTSFSLRYMIMKLYCVNNKDIAVELRLFFSNSI